MDIGVCGCGQVGVAVKLFPVFKVLSFIVYLDWFCLILCYKMVSSLLILYNS